MNFSDINIYDVGNKWTLLGAVFGDEDGVLLCMFPDATVPPKKMDLLPMTDEEWHTFIRQSDLLETEVLTKSPEGKVGKAILRKTQRVIDNRVSWGVYKRDGYRCRYCGRDGVPLTVDHLICWEVGGPSDNPDNLATSCRKCNKVRGSTPYAEWIIYHPHYKKVCKGLTNDVRTLNINTIETIANIPYLAVERKKRK
jgi:hypothetical protein